MAFITWFADEGHTVYRCSQKTSSQESGLAPEFSQDWVAHASARLESLTQSTEAEFLQLGGQLRDIVARSRDISRQASEVAAQMSGASLTAAVQRLQSIHSHLTQGASGSRLVSGNLDSVLKPFEEIPKQLDSLHRTVRILEMTGFLVKIEDARFGDIHTGFSTVAANLQTLCKQIRVKSEDLRSRSSLISASLDSGLHVIAGSERQLHQSMQLILERVLSSLTRLRNKHQSSTGTLQTISSRYRAISKSIGEVIVSLQFHDITRQRMEHAMTALQQLAPECAGSDGAGGLSTAEMASTCRLQADQLRHAMQAMIQAVEQIRRNLQALVADESAISTTTLDLAGFDAAGEHSFLAGIEQELISLGRAFDEYGQINQHIAEAVTSILDTVRDMSGFATDISRMGTEMRFVAMNASINAARIGDRGVSLGVLAINTQELARQTSDDIQVIADALQSIFSVAQTLSSHSDSSSDLHSTFMQGLNAEFQSVRNDLHTLDEQLGSTLKDIDAHSRQLSADVSAAAERMQSPYALQAEIHGLSDSLESYAARIFSGLTDEEQRSYSLLANLESGYTMQAERELHRAHLDGLKGNGGREAAAVASDVPDGGELGDNVELF